LEYARREPARRDSILETNRLFDYLKSFNRQRVFLQLFDHIGTILTTSHVIAELQGLQRLKGELARGFWLCGMEWLRKKNLDERLLLRLLDMDEKKQLKESVCAIGPTDTGLIDLARREGCVLLTDDRRTLAPYAWGQAVDCRLVETLIGPA
jgi:rRNA-processing protein FCF1